MSNEKWDAFGDVVAQAHGVFGPEQAALQPGLKRHQTVHAQVDRAGVMLQFECQVCGQPAVLLVEYPEVVAIKYGVNPVMAFQGRDILNQPTRWTFNGKGWTPEIHCGNCNTNAGRDLLIEPHELEPLLKSARRRGYINPQGEHTVSQICAQVAQQGGQSARR